MLKNCNTKLFNEPHSELTQARSKAVPLKIIRVRWFSQGLFLLENLFRSNFSMLWEQLTKHSMPLFWGGGTNLRDRYGLLEHEESNKISRHR